MKNCISYWLPRLESAGVPVPKTVIVKTEFPLINLLDGNNKVVWPVDFIEDVTKALVEVSFRGYGNAFLRSGDFSGKHEWRNTCYIKSVRSITPKQLLKQIVAMMVHGECLNMFGFPWDVWAAREYLWPGDGDVAFISEQFAGMPVRREFRVFVEDAEIKCIHPYWPVDAFRDLTEERRIALDRISDYQDNADEIRALASAAGESLVGAWSVDLLHTEKGWYVTDCAVADVSWHWPECPNA